MLSLLAVALAAGAAWFAYFQLEIPGMKASSPPPQTPQSASRTDAPRTDNLQFIKLFNPTPQGIVMTEKGIQGETLAVRLAEAIVAEFLKQLPPGASDAPRLLGVYRDKNNVLYVDVSGSLRAAAAGDARKEHDLIKALVLSLNSNISALHDVRLLVDGKESDTLAGHVSLSGPLRQLAQETGPAAGGKK
jgi:hypothetical protein